MKIVVRHSAARKRRRGGVFDSARLNQLNSSWTFTRARESAPPYGVAAPAGALVRCASDPSFQNHHLPRQSFSDRFVSAPACCCVSILAFAERTRALEVDCLRLLVIWQRCDIPHELARGTEMYVCSTAILRRRETRTTVAWNNPLTQAHVIPHSETWRLQHINFFWLKCVPLVREIFIINSL